MDDDLSTATRRAAHLARSGATVVGVSQQAGFAGLAVLWTFLTAIGFVRPVGVVWTVLAAIGATVAITAWVRARRSGSLLPFVVLERERPLAVLDPARRRELRRQMRRPDAVTAPYAGLIRGLVEWQRRSSRAAVPMLVGMLLGLLGLSGSIATNGGPAGWSLMIGTIAVAVFITVISRLEARRQLAIQEQTRGDRCWPEG